MVEPIRFGYAGKLLRVNLTEQKVSVEPADNRVYRQYLGGAGFVTYFLAKEMKPGTDALSPDSKLVFALGPATGVPLPGTGRNCVGARSPLTGTIAKSEVGGFWGAELKRAGYDVVIIEGRASKPVYLWISPEAVTIRDAGHLWGRNTKETQDSIRAELKDSRVQVASIGPAGENMVRFACILNGLRDAAGRGGLGAVMGSKNLKAVAVRGMQAPAVFDADALNVLRTELKARMGRTAAFHDFGTGLAMPDFEASGNLPVRNFRDNAFPDVRKIDATTIKETIRVGMDGCFACPVRCKKVVRLEQPYPVDPAYGGPEYETLASLGSDCGVNDLAAIAKGNELCQAYSLDTISTGGVIAFAMECFEKGLLSPKQMGGVEARFGNSAAMLALIEKIALREGIGDLLAEGSARAGRLIGGEAPELAMQVKGLELGMHDPRCKSGLGLGYMVSSTGGDHCCNIQDTMYTKASHMTDLEPLGILEPLAKDDIGPRKVDLFRFVQADRILLDCMVICLFLPYTHEQLAALTGAITGWHTGIVEQLRVAQRVLTLARLFNIREGFTADDDRLPRRFFGPRIGAAPCRSLDPVQFDQAKAYYYTLMGWDRQTGVPLPETLEDLGISSVTGA